MIGGVVNWRNFYGKQCRLVRKKSGSTILSCKAAARYLSKEYKNTNIKRFIHPCLHSNIHSSQDIEANYPSTGDWINNFLTLHRIEYYLAITKMK